MNLGIIRMHHELMRTQVFIPCLNPHWQRHDAPRPKIVTYTEDHMPPRLPDPDPFSGAKRYLNEGTAGVGLSSLQVDSGTSPSRARFVIHGGDSVVITEHRTAREIIAQLQAAFPERRSGQERRQA